jgi:hypothetical protein
VCAHCPTHHVSSEGVTGQGPLAPSQRAPVEGASPPSRIAGGIPASPFPKRILVATLCLGRPVGREPRQGLLAVHEYKDTDARPLTLTRLFFLGLLIFLNLTLRPKPLLLRVSGPRLVYSSVDLDNLGLLIILAFGASCHSVDILSYHSEPRLTPSLFAESDRSALTEDTDCSSFVSWRLARVKVAGSVWFQPECRRPPRTQASLLCCPNTALQLAA